MVHERRKTRRGSDTPVSAPMDDLITTGRRDPRTAAHPPHTAAPYPTSDGTTVPPLSKGSPDSGRHWSRAPAASCAPNTAPDAVPPARRPQPIRQAIHNLARCHQGGPLRLPAPCASTFDYLPSGMEHGDGYRSYSGLIPSAECGHTSQQTIYSELTVRRRRTPRVYSVDYEERGAQF
jgi:hypothetical protein